MTDDEAKRLADCIRDCSFHLHSFLKWGHLEKVYENGLAHRLEKAGAAVERQFWGAYAPLGFAMECW
jgi:hypothetical protein